MEQVLKDHLYNKIKESAWRRYVQIELLKDAPRPATKERRDEIELAFESDNIDYGTDSDSENDCFESSGKWSISSSDSEDSASEN